MRDVLKTLSHSRSQKLEVLYHNTSMDQQLSRSDPGLAADFVHDKCETNQIVYGHGVNPGIAQRYGISDAGVKYIAMIREPMAWAVSLYKEFTGRGDYHGSFEKWVRDGRSKVTYVHYFVWPSDSTESLEKRAQHWMESPEVLTLFTENYDASIHNLAVFLQASSAEESAMRKIANFKHNVRPESSYNVTLSEASLETLKKDLTDAYVVYDVALRLKTKDNMRFQEDQQTPMIRRVSENSDIMEIITTQWPDDED